MRAQWNIPYAYVRHVCVGFLLYIAGFCAIVQADALWRYEWPQTDFSKSTVELSEIRSGGPPKDGIPAIDAPIFLPISEATAISKTAPVISIDINGDARAYPISILTYHEIVNDTVGGVPVAVTYCPLCNASIVFRREVNGQILDFGTTGKLRKSDMIMYDRQSESWWQQFTGEAIIGEYVGFALTALVSRLESFGQFSARHLDGKVLIPNDPKLRPYGTNPYIAYDSASWPFLFTGSYDKPILPLARVVAIGSDAWPLSLIRKMGAIAHNDIIIRWQGGRSSPLDTRIVDHGKDIGTITAQRNGADILYHLPFAFAFFAFNEDGILHLEAQPYTEPEYDFMYQ